MSWLNNVQNKKLSGHVQVLSGGDKGRFHWKGSRELPRQCKCGTSCFTYTTWCKYQNSANWTLKILFAFYWTFIRRTDAEVPILWLPDAKSWLIRKDPWCWERLRVGGEGGDRGWDGWMASPTQWTWVWADFRRWWRAGKPACCSPQDCKELNLTEQGNDGSILNIK